MIGVRLSAVMLWGALAISGCAADSGVADGLVDSAIDAGGADAAVADVGAADALVSDCLVSPGQIELPADDGLHAENVEWWYWTGRLEDEQGRAYGFQVTFFAFGAGAARALLANVAVTDLDAGTYHRAAKFEFGVAEALEGRFSFELGPQTGAGGGGSDRLHAEADGYVLELALNTDAPAVRHHGDGYQAYGFGGYTYYYSRPRMAATGTLTVDGVQRAVEGTGWFDHQWGDLEAITDRGWDWFALSLDDGRDLMLFLVRGEDGAEPGSTTLVGGTLVDNAPVCRAVDALPSDQVEVISTGRWTSPESGCVYPQGWQIKIGELSLDLSTRVPEQEMYNSRDNSKTYWEGAVEISGDATGHGYVELAGYCQAQ